MDPVVWSRSPNRAGLPHQLDTITRYPSLSASLTPVDLPMSRSRSPKAGSPQSVLCSHSRGFWGVGGAAAVGVAWLEGGKVAPSWEMSRGRRGGELTLLPVLPQTIPGATRRVCGAAARRNEGHPAQSTAQGPARRTSRPKSPGSRG